jgi:oxygen-independent coproporphyrinogen-3 oxidase
MESHLPGHPLSHAAPGADSPAAALPRARARLAAPPDGPGACSRAEARAGLYVHVPFCAARCSYCDFSSGPISSAALDRYVRALGVEVEQRAAGAAGIRFQSVFFGGGTPSALPARLFREVVRRLRGAFDIAREAEVTLEANPESVRERRLEAWANGGVNRLSMGAQSFDPRELGTLGRIHDADRPAAAVALARSFGFRRLSLDLMFGFPGQRDQELARSLNAALGLGIEHLSAYCFIPEPGTPLGDAVLAGGAPACPPELQADLYERVVETCADAGMSCYETSNFCQPDAEARHNLVYWLRRPYLGLGPSAHSLLGGSRFANHYAFARWAASLEAGASPESERESCDACAAASEIVLLGLRLGRGLDPEDYAPREWAEVESRFGAALDRAVAASRVERTHWGWRVAPARRFVADEAIAWVLARESSPGPRPAPFDSTRAHSIMRESCSSLPSPAI